MSTVRCRIGYFTWGQAIRGDNGHFTFLDCKFNKPIGGFKPGDKFGRIDVYNDDCKVVIGEEIYLLEEPPLILGERP